MNCDLYMPKEIPSHTPLLSIINTVSFTDSRIDYSTTRHLVRYPAVEEEEEKEKEKKRKGLSAPATTAHHRRICEPCFSLQPSSDFLIHVTE